MAEQANVLILGIGNLLWADEGFGVRAVEEMHRCVETPDNVTLMDGGTQGIYLVQHVREADVLIVFDAVDYGLPPGTIRRVEDDAVPQFLGAKKVSLHQTGFQEVIAMAEMMGDAPERLLLIGVQPEELDDYGGGLRDSVRAQIRPAIDLALDELARLGIEVRPRPQPLPPESTIACPIMTAERYEGGRPPADQAFRRGDMRVLAGGAFAPPDDPDAEVEAILARSHGGAG
ncbi:HyaD/HybD family hydrogenase maturation endopeptidase [Profundibacter sp.]|uniref:HyaD/HybD family hydrogenase maturation endopeptidase n=1 Tax=Profundibacter sp. TaxID=3101071 RepID=UPI003D0C7EB5